MSLRISVVGTNCGSITRSILRGLKELGCWADAFIYQIPESKSVVRRVFDRIADPGLELRAAKMFNESLCSALDRKPDVLIVLKGEKLNDESRRRLDASRTLIASWTFDSLSRCPHQASIWPWARASFVIDGGDTQHGNRRSIWMPLGYDEKVYTPSTLKDIDVLLIGRLGRRYTNRRTHLAYLANSDMAKCLKIGFIGTCENRVRNLKLRNARQRLYWIAPHLSECELGEWIARSKICINILQDDGLRPINPMFFAIPGAGGCQLTLHRQYLSAWLRPGIEFESFTEGKFLEHIRELIGDPERIARISKCGFESVVSAHTYKHRVHAILTEIGIAEPHVLKGGLAPNGAKGSHRSPR